MGKIAIVTGASSGMGREFVRQIPKLYKNLDEIWVTARRTALLKELQEEVEIPIRTFGGDLTKNAVSNRMQKEMEEADVQIRLLVNAAGYGKVGQYEDLDVDEQLGMIDLNCKGLTKMCLLSLPYMGAGSRIINLCSASAFAPEPGLGVYAATKSYVYSLSRSLNEELKDRGISVTAVCPGPVDTPFFERAGSMPDRLSTMGMASPVKVVRQALIDSVNRKPVSVYGAMMKTARVGAKVLPSGVVLPFLSRVMKRNADEGEIETDEAE